MALSGFVEWVGEFQVRGWAFESELPSHHVQIQVFLKKQLIISATASLFRDDLEQEGVGAGDHAFIANLDRGLSAADKAEISVFALNFTGSCQLLTHLAAKEVQSTFLKRSPIQFAADATDNDQHPVFILGAARSGTSAMAQGLLKLKRFEGFEEGHTLDLMAPLQVATNNFYSEKSDDLLPQKNTAISLIPRGYVSSALDRMFIEMIRNLYPEGSWLDKTPNPNMIFLAPSFRRIWPNSRFIFMKRRPIENLASRLIKFPEKNFVDHCKEWRLAMSAWLEIRSQLVGSAIEIDQFFLHQHPAKAAGALKIFLTLTDEQTLRLRQAFEFDRPERTAATRAKAPSLGETGWSEDQVQFFTEICSPLMLEYGYGQGAEYFEPGAENNGLVWV